MKPRLNALEDRDHQSEMVNRGIPRARYRKRSSNRVAGQSWIDSSHHNALIGIAEMKRHTKKLRYSSIKGFLKGEINLTILNTASFRFITYSSHQGRKGLAILRFATDFDKQKPKREEMNQTVTAHLCR